MPTPILATKLYVPRPRPTGVHRPRLVERLNHGLHRKVTLISAPAGFGKTTLVSEWLTGEPAETQALPKRQVAWLSLDEGDSEPTRFLTYLVAALRTVAPKLGEGVLDALQSPQPAPTESILAALLNEIATLTDKFVLVLDDYHVIDYDVIDTGSPLGAVGDALTFLIEHLPPQLHLVITTREDPDLPLARLRARDQLTELRGADLRFTPTEAAGFLQAMNLNLSTEDVAALERRTEGWIAGLQLAALSMQGQEDVAGFIRSFAGDHRYIVDYLVEEVLQRQPEAVRSFLLQTAILDELNGPLCDAVTGQTEGKARLGALERGNFFVVPLDDKRHWYRYHHLFADVLQVHLLAGQPDLVPTLHGRASEWYEQQGSTAQAIRHALAAKDFVRVANLIEYAIPALGRRREGPTLLGWLKTLPDEIVQVRPILCVNYAWASMASGELEAIEPWLQKAERWLETIAETGERPAAMIVANEEEFRHLPGSIALYRAGRAQLLGEVDNTLHYAQRVIDLAPADAILLHGAGTALLGLALWTSGDLEQAHRTYAAGMASVQLAGSISDVINSANFLADIRVAQGRLREAMSTLEQSLRFASKQGEAYLQATANHYIGMSELHYEHNDLDAAVQHLQRSKALSEQSALPHSRARWSVAMARIRQTQGDLEGALSLLNEADRLYVADFSPDIRPVAASRARVWLAQGRLGEALSWAREQSLSPHDNLSYLREFEHITLARVLLARYQSDRAEQLLLEAMGLLDRLLQAAEAGERTGNVIEILIVQALTHQAQDDIAAALIPLQQALTLAEPEGYFRIFVDEGPPMAHLLRAAAAQKIMPPYTAKLLAAIEGEQPSRAGESPLPTTPSARPLTSRTFIGQPLIEPLSERELEVLRLFATELSGPEIADELVIALSTVRTHTKGIYSKLNVNSRREAVKRAEELNLI
ncbi:MAG: tetratricopeptide repeat protein [Caldilineaceae bacterium]|nr:tetratricopeptide repeat protein [Caldilineaceae bacterium]